MSARTWVVGGAFLLLAGINGYLLTIESSEYFDKMVRSADGVIQMDQSDPLLDIVYTRTEREKNFASFGMDAGLVKATNAALRDMEDEYAKKIPILLDQADDLDALADALCGETRTVRPRYGALRFIVTEEKGRRQAVRLSKASGLEYQEWAKVAPIGAVYAELELSSERKPDATLMALAAILEGKEQDVFEHNAPWGQGLTSAWSWSKVKKENPRVESAVRDYFATMHLIVEIAQGEEGICEG